MSKMGGGLKGGIKQADMTRRLDENLSAGDFERARGSSRLRRQFRSLSEQLFYIFIGIALLFCAARFTLTTWFPGKVHDVLHPILGRNSAAIEETLTGSSTPDDEDMDEEATAAKKAADEKKAALAMQQAKQKKKKPKQSRHKHRAKHHSSASSQSSG
ncbi:MAG TPA: hypothetical protein V6C72_09115 [Chroococcales cyanobacterium]